MAEERRDGRHENTVSGRKEDEKRGGGGGDENFI